MSRAPSLALEAIRERGAALRRAEGEGDLALAYGVLTGLSDADFAAVALEAGHSLIYSRPIKQRAHVQAQVAKCCRERRDGFAHRRAASGGSLG